MPIAVKDCVFLYSVPKLSLMINSGQEVAFFGRSNAGKSSLINAVCEKKHLAKTSKTPGRTRHAVVYHMEFVSMGQEKVINLVDLPGFGFAAMSKKEAKACEELIFSYFAKRPNLILLVVLLDIRRQADVREKEIVEIAKQRRISLLIVLTKCDKIPLSKQKPARAALAHDLGLPRDHILLHSTEDKKYANDIRKFIFDAL